MLPEKSIIQIWTCSKWADLERSQKYLLDQKKIQEGLIYCPTCGLVLKGYIFEEKTWPKCFKTASLFYDVQLF